MISVTVLRDAVAPALATHRPRTPEIIGAVSRRLGVSVEAITGVTGNRPIFRARHITMLLARELTTGSLPVIARSFNRDHTTVLIGCRRGQDHLASEGTAEAVVEILRDLDGVVARRVEQLGRMVASVAEAAAAA